MIAYFALLSFVPLLFLALSLLGFTGQADESSFLVREMKQAFPTTSIDDIVRLVRSVQDNAAALGIVGAAFLVWTALSLFSVLESAFNIVYGRPNRPFIHGKSLALALLVGSLVTLFVALARRLVRRPRCSSAARRGSSATPSSRTCCPWPSRRSASSSSSSRSTTCSRTCASTCGTCCRGRSSRRCCSRRASRSCRSSCAMPSTTRCCRRFGSPAILLVWLYVMANVLIFGAELNWWRQYGREAPPEEAPGRVRLSATRARTPSASAFAASARCECSRFQSFPSSATVRVSPCGRKIGS